MPTFEPPVVYDVPVTVRYPHPGNALLRYYSPGPRGVNVWKLVDGSYTETQPSDASLVAYLYHGAHLHPVDDAEAAALTAAGYGANIT